VAYGYGTGYLDWQKTGLPQKKSWKQQNGRKEDGRDCMEKMKGGTGAEMTGKWDGSPSEIIEQRYANNMLVRRH